MESDRCPFGASAGFDVDLTEKPFGIQCESTGCSGFTTRYNLRLILHYFFNVSTAAVCVVLLPEISLVFVFRFGMKILKILLVPE